MFKGLRVKEAVRKSEVCNALVSVQTVMERKKQKQAANNCRWTPTAN
jgi:hypothetical protein